MRAPHRKRPRLRSRSKSVTPARLDQCAEVARYVGSPEHKTYPSFAGAPKLRSDATPCPTHLKDADVLTQWLRQALRQGNIGEPICGGFPRYVWVVRDGQWFEAMLTNQELGQYKGYPIRSDEAPRDLL